MALQWNAVRLRLESVQNVDRVEQPDVGSLRLDATCEGI